MDEQVRSDQASPAGGLARQVDLQAIAAQAGAENFPVALRMLPRRPRHQLAQVYTYARFVDDVGDEAPGDRLALLDEIEQDVHRLYTGTPRLSPVQGLQQVVQESRLPMQPLLDLIEANRMDQWRTGYRSFEDLLDYCRLSAAPIGQIVLHLAGASDDANRADSDRVCAGLQVLEHCQDVAEDARAGRIYLPADELPVDADLRAGATSPAVRAFVRTQVDRAEQLLNPGAGLVRRLSGWAKIAVAGYLGGGMATADSLKAADFDVLSRHLGPSKLRTAYRMLPLLARR